MKRPGTGGWGCAAGIQREGRLRGAVGRIPEGGVVGHVLGEAVPACGVADDPEFVAVPRGALGEVGPPAPAGRRGVAMEPEGSIGSTIPEAMAAW